ncbi:UNVERIFIED_CONTAM: hypothetical protein FKN15_043300 [Acipenser sinensis]
MNNLSDSDQEISVQDSPLNVMDSSTICSDEIAGPSIVQAKLYPATGPRSPGTRKSRHPLQQTQPSDQLFYKDGPLAKLLKILHENNINVPAGSDRLAVFIMYCTHISATPVLPPPPRCSQPSSPTQLIASPLAAAAQRPRNTAEADPIMQIHFNIFKDIKSLIQPIAVSISAIGTRLDDMDNRVASNSAAIAIPLSNFCLGSCPFHSSTSSSHSRRSHLQPGICCSL